MKVNLAVDSRRFFPIITRLNDTSCDFASFSGETIKEKNEQIYLKILELTKKISSLTKEDSKDEFRWVLKAGKSIVEVFDPSSGFFGKYDRWKDVEKDTEGKTFVMTVNCKWRLYLVDFYPTNLCVIERQVKNQGIWDIVTQARLTVLNL